MAINWNSPGGVHNGVTSLANKAEGQPIRQPTYTRASQVAQQPQLAEQGQNAFTRNSSANGKQLFRI